MSEESRRFVVGSVGEGVEEEVEQPHDQAEDGCRLLTCEQQQRVE